MANPIFIDRVPKKIYIAIFKECGRLYIEDMRKRAKWTLVGVDWREWMMDLGKKYK